MFFGGIHSDEELDSMASQLAMLYIQTQNIKTVSPKDFAVAYMDIQKQICETMKAAR